MSTLSAAECAQLAALEAMGDDEIDASDIPSDSADWSQAKQGLFHRPGSAANCPLYVDAQALEFLEDRAARRNISVSALANELLLEDVELIPAAE